jgi:hypothetical protein
MAGDMKTAIQPAHIYTIHLHNLKAWRNSQICTKKDLTERYFLLILYARNRI